jgi:hypothetical protein
MEDVLCPHCAASNPTDAAFCGACGKAMPPSAASAPRLVKEGDAAATATGLAVQSAQLEMKARKAAGALLAVAILQTVFGTLLILMAKQGRGFMGIELGTPVFVAVFGLAAVFFCLYLWARRKPLPAAIAGLVLFVTVHVLDAVVDPNALWRGILVKIIVIVVLVKAIQAGVQHRKLVRESAGFASRERT